MRKRLLVGGVVGMVVTTLTSGWGFVDQPVEQALMFLLGGAVAYTMFWLQDRFHIL